MLKRMRFVPVLFAALFLFVLAAPATAADKEPILVFGHANPDTDAVISSMAAADILTKTGRPAEARVQGPLNAETTLVVKKFGLKTPELLGPVAGKDIAITDFAELGQGPPDMKDAKLVFVADHHKLGDISSAAPLEAWFMPLGSACTVLFEVYNYYKLDIPKDIAGGMLSAILSDTVIFKSVTTTARDKAAAEALAKAAGVADVKALGIEQFNAKSAIAETPAKKLVLGDYKPYDMSGTKVGVGQMELVDLGPAKARKKELLAAMQEVKKENGLNSIYLMVTDIMQEGTLMYVVSDSKDLTRKAFKQDAKDSELWLPGMMSRKKQVIPPLEEALKK
jgi:manganese-dependent inorganic pyrophosphatase